MKITLLCENTTGYDGAEVCLSEWGLSAFIETENAVILFDTGHTDVYKKNAKELGIDLDTVGFIVLSHHHWDHAGGLRFHDFQEKKKLITHPEVLEKLPKEDSTQLKMDFEITTSRKPLEFAKDVFYLGEIPRKNDFEAGKFEGEEIIDDSAIAIKTSKGCIVFTGCSHSGICNICEYAKEITGQTLYAVIGGFHLFEGNTHAVEKTIEYFKKEVPEYLLPMHCVDFATLAKFHVNFGSKKYSTGDVIYIDN